VGETNIVDVNASDELDAVRFDERWFGMLDLSGESLGGIRGGGSCQPVTNQAQIHQFKRQRGLSRLTMHVTCCASGTTVPTHTPAPTRGARDGAATASAQQPSCTCGFADTRLSKANPII